MHHSDSEGTACKLEATDVLCIWSRFRLCSWLLGLCLWEQDVILVILIIQGHQAGLPGTVPVAPLLLLRIPAPVEGLAVDVLVVVEAGPLAALPAPAVPVALVL